MPSHRQAACRSTPPPEAVYLPTISHGQDHNALIRVLMEHSAKQFPNGLPKLPPGTSMPMPGFDELQAKTQALPDAPDETLK